MKKTREASARDALIDTDTSSCDRVPGTVLNNNRQSGGRGEEGRLQLTSSFPLFPPFSLSLFKRRGERDLTRAASS